ncbi:MAG: hypothetical protein L3J06_06605 [Cyclobacteriaceae bacterium]|nr:hypothetical protein [Cyclobacteriaceae bacterium]
MKTKETLSEQSKRRIVSEVLSGKYSKEQARKLYGIKSKSGILEWMRIFAGESGKPTSASLAKRNLCFYCFIFSYPFFRVKDPVFYW